MCRRTLRTTHIVIGVEQFQMVIGNFIKIMGQMGADVETEKLKVCRDSRVCWCFCRGRVSLSLGPCLSQTHGGHINQRLCT
jgi:hypothetical protein